MGKFIYEGGMRIEFEDRALAHLQLVITTKLRRDECFAFTWKEDPSIGGGRTSVWLHRSAGLVYKFHGSRMPDINLVWIEVLARAANSSTGLYLISEAAAVAGGGQESRRWDGAADGNGASRSHAVQHRADEFALGDTVG